MAEDPKVQPESVSPPEVMLEARVDEKGRLKFPEELKRFLETLPSHEFFVTTVDLETAQIYPIQEWRENKKKLIEETEDPEAARRIGWLVARFGGETKMDGQGRILIPQPLRKKLEIENAPVSILWRDGHAEVYSAAYDEKMLDEVKTWNKSDLTHMRRKGFK